MSRLLDFLTTRLLGMKHNFRELKIWHKSMSLCKEIYSITKHYPKEEMFGLSSQLRRCAVSIPSNIAEGCGRNSDKQLVHYLNISMGSLCELETQITLSHDLNFINKETFDNISKSINDLEKMLFSFKKTIINII